MWEASTCEQVAMLVQLQPSTPYSFLFCWLPSLSRKSSPFGGDFLAARAWLSRAVFATSRGLTKNLCAFWRINLRTFFPKTLDKWLRLVYTIYRWWAKRVPPKPVVATRWCGGRTHNKPKGSANMKEHRCNNWECPHNKNGACVSDTCEILEELMEKYFNKNAWQIKIYVL